MALIQGRTLRLPGLASLLDLDSPEFVVRDLIPGGFGICAKIEHGDTAQILALKGQRPDRLSDHEAQERYLDEAKLWLTLSACDGVVEALAIERVDNMPVVCARWMQGGNLRRYLDYRDSALFYRSAIRITRTLKWAWDNHGVVHRDLKPSNILLDDSRVPYISDWGIARVAVAGGETDATGGWDPERPDLTRGGLGTLFYASPEQLRDARDVDHRSDMYSLGCLLYEWEAGQPPFTGEAPNVIRAHRKESPPRLSGWFRSTDFGAEEVILRCLAKSPDDRFESYDDLLQALLDAARDQGVEPEDSDISLRYRTAPIGRGQLNGFLTDDEGVVRGNRGYAVAEAEDLKIYLEEAGHLMQLGDYKKAARILAAAFVPELARNNPESPYQQSVAINYAVCLTQLEKPQEATKVLSHLSNATALPVEYYINLSDAYLHLADHERAEAAADEGLSTIGDDPALTGNLLLARAGQGKIGESDQLIHRLLEQERSFDSYCAVGYALIEAASASRNTDLPAAAQALGSSIRVLEEARKLNPQHRKPGLLLARAWFDLANYGRAAEVLRETRKLGLHPQEVEYSVGLFARCHLQTAAFDRAIAFCDSWLEHFPDSLELKRVKSRAIIDGKCRGNIHDGKRVVDSWTLNFLASLVEEPNHRKPDDYCDLASLVSWAGDVPRARHLLKKALDIWPEHHETPAMLGELHLNANLQKSDKYASIARDIAPWRTRTWRLTAQVAEKQGDATRAEQARKRKQEVWEFEKEMGEQFD